MRILKTKITLLPIAALLILILLSVVGQHPAAAQDPAAPTAMFPGHYVPSNPGAGVEIDCGGEYPGLRGTYICDITQAGNQITVTRQVPDSAEDGLVRDETFTFTLSGSGGGLDQDAVDARIATFARVNNPSGEIGDVRIPASIARDSELPTTFADLTGDIGESQIPDSIARDSELPTTFGDLTGDIADSQIPASIARDSELPEQRVIDFGDNPTSPDNNLVIALGDGHARIVDHYETPGANAADGGLADFTHANYRGVYANDSAAGTQVAVGQFYFNRHTEHFRERTGTVLASAIFQDFNIESQLLSGAHYQGSYATDQEGLNHSDEAGDVFFQTTSQKIRVTSNNFSAGSSPQTHRSYRRLAEAEEVAASITAHDTSGTAHNDIRSDVSTVEDRLDALDPVEIEAYSSTSTYSRGSANSIVTHANHVWVYRSTQRNTNHDPEQFPQYWWKLDTPIRALNHDSATTTHWRSGDFFLTETGELRMATATISASPADIIADHTGADQEFLWLNEAGGGGGTTVTANPSGTDGADLTRITIGSTNYNIAGRISWAFVIDTLIVPELNQDAITDARIILEDSGLTHYLTFLDWTAANIDMIDHLPVGAHIGLRQGATTRILEVEAEWDSTNRRYQVININTGILSESASGTATELLLTAGTAGAPVGTSTVAFHGGLSADTAITSSQTTWAQVLQLDSSDIDINEGSFTVESQTDNTERACVPDDGLYVVRAQISAEADANTTQRFTLESRFTITPDGGTETAQTEISRQYNRGRDTDAASGATNLSGGHLAVLYDLDADDCIGVQTRTQLSAINYTVEAAVSYLEIVKQQVGPAGPAGSGGGGGSDLAVQEEGTEVASAATVLNFTGAGATATASDGTVTVNIPGGQAGSLDDGSVTTAKLADGAVTTIKLADDAVTGAKIADDTIHGGALIDGTIATIKIGDTQVTGAKLSSNAVSTGKIADDAITTAKVADGAITTAKLAANAAGEGKVPIDDTMQFDGSGDLGVNTERVVQDSFRVGPALRVRRLGTTRRATPASITNTRRRTRSGASARCNTTSTR